MFTIIETEIDKLDKEISLIRVSKLQMALKGDGCITEFEERETHVCLYLIAGLYLSS